MSLLKPKPSAPFYPILMDREPTMAYYIVGLEVNVRRVLNRRISSEDALDADLPVP